MNVDFRHIITLIIASFISIAANADMSHPASSNFSDVFATTDRPLSILGAGGYFMPILTY